jgi:hypothetical protein
MPDVEAELRRLEWGVSPGKSAAMPEAEAVRVCSGGGFPQFCAASFLNITWHHPHTPQISVKMQPEYLHRYCLDPPTNLTIA